MSRITAAMAACLVCTCAGAEIASEPFTPAGSFTSGVEGPAVDASGNLFACNYQRAGTIGKVTAAGEASIYAEMPAGGRSAGLHFDRNGDLIALDYINHLVYRMDASRAAFLEVLTRDWTGPAFRQPNDLTVAPDNSIYFSDPDWSSAGGGRVFLVTPGQRRRTMLAAENLHTPNGLAVSPDGARLYVAQSRGHNVLVFDRQADGALENQRVFFDTGSVAPGALPDGVKCDPSGNVYVALHGAGKILALSADGKVLPSRTVRTTGSKPTNIAFGPDGRTLYVTEVEHGRIEKVRLPED